ncbi:MAG: hypothetical protein AAGD07_10145 [Planctomycetota bacterium]
MNLQQLAALTRMRWQIGRNLVRKSGRTNQVLLTIALVLAFLGSIGTFLFALGWGSVLINRLQPYQWIYVWDAITVVFLFVWSMGVLTELQRSELLSLKNLLHLPVSLSGGFFLNYLSSIVSLTVLLFLPVLLGICCVSVLHFGSASSVSFLLVSSFLLMVSAVTYLIRGWLGKLMENPRTRGTVVAVTTIFFVLVFQLPNMLNSTWMRSGRQASRERREAHREELDQLRQQLEDRTLASSEYKPKVARLKEAFQQQENSIRQAKRESTHQRILSINQLVPVLWLPYGAASAARGSIASPLLCIFGMTAFGLASLGLSYRSTVQTYIGNDRTGKRSATHDTLDSAKRRTRLEMQLPLLTNTQSAIALATWRMTLRAPESKMALLTPLIFAAMFGSAIFSGSMSAVPQAARPWLTLTAISVSLFGLAQLLINMFGMDRQGFRAYILMPIDRGDILLGKNLGVFPIVGGLTSLLVVAVGILARVPSAYVLATLLQVPITFLCYFLVTNQVSITAPVGLISGTMKPVSLKAGTVITQLLAMFFSPLMMLPAAIALGVDFVLNFYLKWPPALGRIAPVYLILTLVELPIMIWVYRRLIARQGKFLQDREQQILDTITKVAG